MEQYQHVRGSCAVYDSLFRMKGLPANLSAPVGQLHWQKTAYPSTSSKLLVAGTPRRSKSTSGKTLCFSKSS
jgi:hypothetical protein